MQQQQQVVADLSSSHQASPNASSRNPPSSSSLSLKVVNSILLWLEWRYTSYHFLDKFHFI
jgi:hypothetical protein